MKQWLKELAMLDTHKHQQHSEAQLKARVLWKALKCSKDKDKGVGVRFCDDVLIVPVYNCGELSGLQYIYPDGLKLFMAGTRLKGSYFYISGRKYNDGTIAITEGYAEGVTINKATGWPVFVAFNASNLEAVAVQVRQLWPSASIVICADRDHRGETKATEAANAVKGLKLFLE